MASKYYDKKKNLKQWHNFVTKKGREYINAKDRERYRKRKDNFQKKYGVIRFREGRPSKDMARNILNERVQLYLSNPEYYKERLIGKIKEDQLEIAYYYLDDATHSLFATGRQFHISKERVRQICYKVLYTIWKMKPEKENIMISNKDRKGYKLFKEDPQKWEDVIRKNLPPAVIDISLMFLRDDKPIPEIRDEIKKDRGWVYQCVKRALNLIENMEENKDVDFQRASEVKSPNNNSLRQDEFDAIKELLYQGETPMEIVENPTINRSEAVIQRVAAAKTLEEFFQKQRDYYKDYIARKRRVNVVVKSTPPLALASLPSPRSFADGFLPPHWQQIADAIDAMVKEQVEIKIKEYKQELKRRLEET